MNPLLKGLIEIKFKSQFAFKGKDKTEDILSILLLVFALLYGFGLSFMINMSESGSESYSISTLAIGVFTAIIYLVGTKGLLPMYVRYDSLFLKAYPLIEFERVLYEFFVSLISARSLAGIVFLLPLLYKITPTKGLILLVGISAVIIGNILNLAIHKYLLNIKLIKKTAYASNDLNLHSEDYFTIRRLFRDAMLLKLMIIPIVLKLIFLALEYSRMDRPSHSIDKMSGILIMFVTPLLLFLQLFLNLFSHQKDYYSWFRYKDHTFRSLWRSYLVSLAIPLFFDLVIAFTLLYFLGLLKIWFFIGNVLLTILLVMIGFVTSIARPVDAAKRAMNFRSSSDIMSGIGCIVVAILLLSLNYYWVVGIFAVCFIFLIWRIYYIKNNLNEYMKYFSNTSEL